MRGVIPPPPNTSSWRGASLSAGITFKSSWCDASLSTGPILRIPFECNVRVLCNKVTANDSE